MAVTSMTDTLGPEVIVPSALVFGEYPSTKTLSEAADPCASLESRARVATTARKHMEQEMAKLKVQRALRNWIPRATNYVLEVGRLVLPWREK